MNPYGQPIGPPVSARFPVSENYIYELRYRTKDQPGAMTMTGWVEEINNSTEDGRYGWKRVIVRFRAIRSHVVSIAGNLTIYALEVEEIGPATQKAVGGLILPPTIGRT